METTNEKWVYEKGKLTLHTQLRDGKCVYTGKTEEYYQSLGFVIDTYENILPLLEEAEAAKFLHKKWEQITEEAWMDALECLPPQKWERLGNTEIFRMSEFMTGNITRHYLRHFPSKTYWRNFRRTTTSYETMHTECLLQIKELKI